MYYQRVAPVPLPETGHLHIQKNGYVYWEDDVKWDKSRNRSIDSRRSIGRLDPSNSKRMFPNRTYFELFPPACETHLFSHTLDFGPYAALTAAAEKTGCLSALRETFPADWQNIFALAMHSVVTERSTAQDFPFWRFHNYCGLNRPISSEGISELYERIAAEPEQIGLFLSGFRKRYHDRWPEAKEKCMAFDSTNQSSGSKGTTRAEWGHAKKNDKVPQINTAIFTDERTGIPLFYEHFLGSILDKTETPYTLEKARALGFEKLFLMMDRGYFSRDIAQAFSGFEFGVMTPSNAKVVRYMVDTYGKTIMYNESYYLPEERIYGIHATDVDALDGKYDAYLFFDANRANDERNHIHDRLTFLMDTAQKRKRYTENMKKLFGPDLLIEKAPKDPETGKNFTVTYNDKYVTQELADAGYFVIISNAGLSAADMIRIARNRDAGEKSFLRLKSHFGLTSPYTHSNGTYEGKMFMAFVGLIVIESYRWFIRSALEQRSSATIATTLGELSKYQITTRPDGSWMPLYAPTKKQKDLLMLLGITAETLEASARRVNFRV